MRKRLALIPIGTIISIILLILTWPRLELQVKIGSEGKTLNTWSPQFTVSVWNRGGMITDWRLITPESCINATIYTDIEIKCTHQTAEGMKPCSIGVCGKSPAQDTSPVDTLTLDFGSGYKRPLPENFTIKFDIFASIGPIKIKELDERYHCSINPKPIDSTNTDTYNCTQVV